ncbi:MAG: rhodanese-like domain-containing protein [Betaproteobacteria bacterium]|nr:rhodanese-like domain-containing protein [Betaproteobacteria bacterium]MDE2047232.1 rhodanese-like domain-containing protein [Betaproteobacteria bacterium]
MNIGKFVIDNILLIVAAVVSGSLLAWPSLMRRAAGPGVSVTEATRLVNREKGVIVDVCEPAEFAAGHIAGARNIPLAALESRLSELPKDKALPVIVVCASGARAGKAASVLRAKGYENARVLEGGMNGWRHAAMPVERTA